MLKVQARALDGHGGTSPFAEGTTNVAAGNGHAVASYGFEEASGNVASDQWGGNDGTVTGATRTNAGRFGRALSFDGDDDLVTVPDDTSLHLGGAMTLEAWVKPDQRRRTGARVIFKEADGGLAYGLYANSDQDVPHVHIGNQGDFGVDGPSELDPNKWTHLAATFDGNIARAVRERRPGRLEGHQR